MVIKIRKATQKDLKRIDEIYVEGSIDEGKYQFPNVSTKEMESELNRFQNARRQGFRRDMKDRKHFWIVAENNKQIIGFGQAWIKNKETGITESVYVKRKFRKKGIGKKIMREMIGWLKKQKLKHIESSAYIRNRPSIKLHNKLGFKPFSVRMRLK